MPNRGPRARRTYSGWQVLGGPAAARQLAADVRRGLFRQPSPARVPTQNRYEPHRRQTDWRPAAVRSQTDRQLPRHRTERTEWLCQCCDTTNWEDRKRCRQCGRPSCAHKGMGKGKGTGRTLKPEAGAARRPTPPDKVPTTRLRTQPASRNDDAASWADRARQANEKASALEQRAAAARRAGSEAAPAMATEAHEARVAATEAKPLHVRAVRLQEKVAQAKAKVGDAMASLELAKKRYEQADAHLANVTEQLSEVEEQTANEAPGDGSTDDRKLVRTVRALLAHLEVQGGLGSDGPLTDTACKLHMMCEALQPTAPGRLDAPLDDDFAECTTDTAMPPQQADAHRAREQDEAKRARKAACAATEQA